MGCEVVSLTLSGVLSGIGPSIVQELSEFRNVEWNSTFRCANVKVAGHTVNIYSDGKFFLFGIKSSDEVSDTMNELGEMFSSMSLDVDVVSVSIVQYTIHWSIGRRVDLYRAVIEIPFCVYEPDISSSLS